MMKVFLLLVAFLALASCGSDSSFEGKLFLGISPGQAAIVPTARRSCSDIYDTTTTDTKSVGESSVGFSSIQLTWLDTARDLYVVKVQLDLESTVVASKIDITDPDEISRLFGLGVTGDVKIPRKGGTGASTSGVYRSDIKDFDGDLAMDDGELACALAFGTMTVPDNTNATVSGQIRLLAVAQDDAGNQELARVNFPVTLIISTD